MRPGHWKAVKNEHRTLHQWPRHPRQEQNMSQPTPVPTPEQRTRLGCGRRHPCNPDGTPVGGALPCGH